MKTLAKNALIAALLGGVAFTAPALAKGRMGTMFEKIDANGDGYIDRAEIQAARDARFAAADTNGDGALSSDEMKAARDDAQSRHGQGRKGVSFSDIDTDGDGTISQAEFDAAKSKRAERVKDYRNKRGARMIERMDANGDGLIQKSELGGGFADRMFERLDADKDGRISKAEAEAARGGMKHRKKN